MPLGGPPRARHVETRRGPVTAAVAVVALLWALLTGTVGAPAASAAGAIFGPMSGAKSFGQGSLAAHVVAGQSGVFHAVARSDAGGQRIEYRRSPDGGRSWLVRGAFRGTAGGAKDPWIAAYGDRVAIVFIGLWCPPKPDLCAEAPFLVTSVDDGVTWSSPRRLAPRGSDPRVAVDGPRTWVVWQQAGTTHVRGTKDGGATFFAESSIAGLWPQVAAADDTAVVATSALAGPRGPLVPKVAVADGDVLGGWRAPFPAGAKFGGWEDSVATSQGAVHVLGELEPVTPGASSAPLVVASAGRDGVFGAVHEIGSTGYSASITAGDGVAAVAVATSDGVSSVSTSLDDGGSWSRLLPVSHTAGREPLVSIGAQRQVQQVKPRISWSVPDRYVPGGVTVDQALAAGVPSLTVHLDGCASDPSPDSVVTELRWTVDGKDLQGNGCTADFHTVEGIPHEVQLTVVDDSGATARRTITVQPRDYLLVSVGDGTVSGEGAPAAEGAKWLSPGCRTSARSAAAVAASQLEMGDAHTSVTLVQAACATATSTGVVNQLTSLQALAGIRDIDGVLLSVGRNDIDWSTLVAGCMSVDACHTGVAATLATGAVAELRTNLQTIIATLTDTLLVDESRVSVVGPLDPTSGEYGTPDLKCVADRAALAAGSSDPDVAGLLRSIDAGGVIDDDEAAWLSSSVMEAVNSELEAATPLSGHWIDTSDATSGHGYCASVSLVQTILGSIAAEGDALGAFFPNPLGHRLVGDRWFSELQRQLLLPRSGSDDVIPVDRAVGDLAVMTATAGMVTAVTANVSSGQLDVGATRVVDTVSPDPVTGNGVLGQARPPAVTRSAVVGAWTELAGADATTAKAMIAPVGTRPNLSVAHVSVVQAPADGTQLVAGRPAVIRAVVNATLDSAITVPVTTELRDATDPARFSVLFSVTQDVRVGPGINELILPVQQPPFTVSPGTSLRADVTVVDPPGASPDDAWDNTGVTRGPGGPELPAVTSRPLSVAWTRLDLGNQTEPCSTVASLAAAQTSYARQALPVAAEGIRPSASCDPVSYTATTPGPLEPEDLIRELDLDAHFAGVDAVVAVVPAGWMSSRMSGVVGLSAVGQRGIVIEAGTPDHTLAHELAHSLGLDTHPRRNTPTAGVRVDRLEPREGNDWFEAVSPDKAWTGGATWDALLGLLHNSAAPVPMHQDADGQWVAGAFRVTMGDLTVQPVTATFTVSFGQLEVTDLPDVTVTLGDLTVEELLFTATPVDGNGAPTAATQPVTVSRPGGMSGPGASTTAPASDRWLFSQRIATGPGTVAIRYDLAGATIGTQPLTTPPAVTVTAPAAGASIGRGQDLTVLWTVDDPDSSGHAATLLVSDDAGATWRPLVSRVTGADTVTIPLPADVGGTDIRVKVIVSDGTRFGEAVSGSFSAEPVSAERVVFAQVLPATDYLGGVTLVTAAVDGRGATGIPNLPTTGSTDFFAWKGAPVYREPRWSPDGTRVYFESTLALPDQFPILSPEDSTGGVYEDMPAARHIWSIRPDGTDLRRETAPFWDDNFFDPSTPEGPLRSSWSWYSCPSLSADGSRMSFIGPPGILVADRAADGVRWRNARVVAPYNRDWAYDETVLRDAVAAGAWPALNPATRWGTKVDLRSTLDGELCPRLSPDGTRIATRRQLSYGTTDPEGNAAELIPGGEQSALTLFPVDGGSPQVVSPSGGLWKDPNVNGWRPRHYISGFDWETDSTLIVGDYHVTVEAFPATWEHSLKRLDPATMTLSDLPGPPPAPLPYPNGTHSYLGLSGVDLRTEPNGAVYVADQGCGWQVLDRASGAFDLVPGATDSCWSMPDWKSVATTPSQPRVVVDPVAAPNDPNAPVPLTDVTTVTDAAELAPGADAPVGELPDAADAAVEISGPQPVTLSTATGELVPFEVVELPAPGTVAVAGVPGQPAEVRTGPDGTLQLTPAAGFTGAATLTFAVVGSPTTATLTITVVAPPTPTVVADTVDAATTGEIVIDPVRLLANDESTDPPLRIVSVRSGSTRAYLSPDGLVHVTVGTSPGTFTYTAATASGTTSSAEVTVRGPGSGGGTGTGTGGTPVGPPSPAETPVSVPSTGGGPGTSVTVLSPRNGSAISSGGYFGVTATTTGVAARTTAYVTLDGRAKVQAEVQPGGLLRFQWIPAEEGRYAVRIGPAPSSTVSMPFRLSLKPFGIRSARWDRDRVQLTVATGNWRAGTRVLVTRDGRAVARGWTTAPGRPLVITVPRAPGRYQVKVQSLQGWVYGIHAGVTTLR